MLVQGSQWLGDNTSTWRDQVLEGLTVKVSLFRVVPLGVRGSPHEAAPLKVRSWLG